MSGRIVLVLAAVVVTALVAGFRLIDSPSVERARRLDQRRVEDLTSIKRAVETYQTRRGRLPAALEDVSEVAPADVSLADPVSHAPYGFTPTTTTRYELCAEFALASRPNPPRSVDETWAHAAGRQCFPLEVPPGRDVR